jgi:hypothetical protein
MNYNSYTFFWPPRPKLAIPPAILPTKEGRYWAQIKKNGTGNTLALSPDDGKGFGRQLITMTRHNEAHKAWTPDGKTHSAFRNLPGNGWYYFVAELMHNKVPGIRHINYINDILVADGESLVGTTFEERQKLLADLFGVENVPAVDFTGEPVGYVPIDANTWLAKNYTGNFLNLFQSLTRPEDEGLVLKDPKARLAFCSREDSNSAWQLKCRRPTKVNHF